VNLPDRRLDVYRELIADAAASFGWRYSLQETLGSGERVRPLALPGVEIAVADLLP
jgi:hypothetical protein